MPKKYVTVDGVATLVHHRGPTTLPGAPPNTELGSTIVCCHDAGTDGSQFADLMDALASDHSPLSYDQPGHGRSGELDSLGSVPAMAEHLVNLANVLTLPSLVLLGEGLGAAVALEAAVRQPNLVAAVVAVGDIAQAYELDEDIEALTAITSGKARREFDRSGYAPDTDRSVYQKAFGAWVKTDPRTTLGDRRAQAAWRLSAAETPTLIVIGEHTEAEHVEASQALASAIPNGTTVQLDGAGRRGVLEQPGALATLVGTFLAEAVGNGGRP